MPRGPTPGASSNERQYILSEQQQAHTTSGVAGLNAAVAMGALGYHVHPCRIVLSAEGKKRPTGLPGGWQSSGLLAASDIELVWRSVGATGYLIACGPSGITGVDLDVRPEAGVDGRRSWAEASGPRGAFVVGTAFGGGEHHYFASAGAGNGTGGLPGVDVKGVGGGLFGPGSEVVDNTGAVVGRYVVLSGNPVRSGLTAQPVLPDAPSPTPKGPTETGPLAAFWEPPKSTSAAARQWSALHHRLVAALKHHKAHGWGEAGHRTVRDAAWELARLSPDTARADWRRWFAEAGLIPDTADDKRLDEGLAAPPDVIVPDPPVMAVTPEQEGAPRRLPVIPDAVWDAYAWTRSIRAQARGRHLCPDAVLGAALAAYAAAVPPSVRVETGVKMALGTNLVVSLVGPSGSDKSGTFKFALGIAHDHLVPVISNPNSGESFAASFTHADPEFEGSANKAPRVVKPDPRALFYIAEGGMLAGVTGRAGSTWLPHLRALAMDEALSTTNATQEINRQVPDGSYSAGLVVGFQTTNAMSVLSDTATGTAQRFLWFSALSSEDYDNAPGAVWQRMAAVSVERLGQRVDMWNTREHVLGVAATITERLKAEQRHVRLTRDIMATDDYDAHRHVLVAKLAALAVLADGRAFVEEYDWSWAEGLYTASAAVRDELIAMAADREAEDRVDAAVKAGAADRVRRGYDAAVPRVAGVLAGKVARTGPQTRGALRRGLTARDRGYFDDAVSYAEAQGWHLIC